MAIRRSEYLIGSDTDWATNDPVLKKGQLAISTPGNLMKFGDGVLHYTELPYHSDTGGVITGPFDGGVP